MACLNRRMFTVKQSIQNFSTSLATREMQIRTTLKFLLISLRIAKIFKKVSIMLSWFWCKGNTYVLLLGLQTGATTV